MGKLMYIQCSFPLFLFPFSVEVAAVRQRELRGLFCKWTFFLTLMCLTSMQVTTNLVTYM